jgi:Protein of unknown function (DUF3047)
MSLLASKMIKKMRLKQVWTFKGRSLCRAACLLFGVLACLPVVAQKLQPFSTGSSGNALPPPWRVVGFPGGKKPVPIMDIATPDGERVLRVASDKSYGSATHDLQPVVLGPGSTLRWRWRLDQPLLLTDLKRRDGDDSPIKICAMFDMSTDKLGLIERNILNIARGRTPEFVPAAMLCYLWDHQLPVGTKMTNAFTHRMRFIVMDSGEKQLGQWVKHERDLAADFIQAFGHETDVMPPLVGILVGADADNTQSTSLAYVGDVVLTVGPVAATGQSSGQAAPASASAPVKP